MTLAVLSLLGMTDIHRMNSLKAVLGALVNGVAVVAFIVAGAVAWVPAVVMIAGGIRRLRRLDRVKSSPGWCDAWCSSSPGQ